MAETAWVRVVGLVRSGCTHVCIIEYMTLNTSTHLSKIYIQLGGNSLLECVVFGRIAGREAVAGATATATAAGAGAGASAAKI